MKKMYVSIILTIMLMSAAGCGKDQVSDLDTETAAQPQTIQTEEATTEHELMEDAMGRELTEEEMKTAEPFTIIDFESKVLAGTLTEEVTMQQLCVYLPPSYQESGKSYPVVYYLHGFGENGTSFLMGQGQALDEAFSAGAKEFIMVSIGGATKAGGSFYVNSPVCGNWEDYIVSEVIPIIDTNFRTLAHRDSRGIVGFSMGGFGAINLSLQHPDVFGSFLAMSPGLLEDGDLPAALESWASDRSFLTAYAQAFSPNEEDKDTYGTIPKEDGTPEDEEIKKDWENGFGNVNQKIEDYLSLNQPLNAIKIIYGDKDQYSWIPRGCEFMSNCLTEQGIEHSLEKLNGAHNIPSDVTETYMVPFFNENLVYE